jgi:VWFA-related protein
MFKGRSTPHWLSVCLCFSLVAVSSPLSAQSLQEPEPEPIPSLTIRVSSRLVLVDVVVTDKHGQPVLGLQPTDFTVTEKGKPQKISVFTPPNPTPAQPAAPALPPGEYSNRPEYRAPGGPPTVILLDAANTSFPDQTYARTQMLKWVVDEYRPGDRVAVFALTNGLVALSDFTDDPQILLDVLRHYVAQIPAGTGRPAPPDLPASVSGAASQSMMMLTQQLANFHSAELQFIANRRADVTIAAMRSLIRILGGIPGRKNIVWLTAGFPFSLIPQQATGLDPTGSRWTNAELAGSGGRGSFQTGLDPGQQRLYADKVRDIAAEFASSQVAIYPVDVTGLDTARFGEASFQRQETMKEIARETGGQAFVNENDLHRGVELAFADRAASYTVGYYPEDKKWDGNYRKISVKVNRDGVEVRNRRGYFAVDPAKEKENEKKLQQDLSDAVQDRISSTQIAFDAKVSAIDSGKTRVEFIVDGSSLSVEDADKGKHVNVNFAVVVFGPNGKTVSNQVMKLDKVLPLQIYQEIVQQGLTVHLDLATPPGRNLAWLAVRDNHNGYVGTLQAPVGQ